jgi:hypothetical protein
MPVDKAINGAIHAAVFIDFVGVDKAINEAAASARMMANKAIDEVAVSAQTMADEAINEVDAAWPQGSCQGCCAASATGGTQQSNRDDESKRRRRTGGIIPCRWFDDAAMKSVTIFAATPDAIFFCLMVLPSESQVLGAELSTILIWNFFFGFRAP